MEFKLFESYEQAVEILKEKKPRLIKAADKNICMVRVGSVIHAFVNECPHLGESLHKGIVNPFHEIVCPLHFYRFNLETGEECEQRCSSLQFVTVLDKAGQIYLQL